jgi:ATP-dependent DNA ligase
LARPVYLSSRKCTIYSKRGNTFSRFDELRILWLRGRDLRHLPLIQRKKRLERLLPEAVAPLNRVPFFTECQRELFEAACQLDLEGIVAKRKADPYNQRVRWWKVKNPLYTQAEGRGELFEPGLR